MLSVAHNLTSMNSMRMLGINSRNQAKKTEKLSSGYKINRAADDAAGLAISEKMRRQIRGLSQGVRNTEEGVSVCQVADGALEEVTDMLHRMEELSVKSANGTNSDIDREYIQEEIDKLLLEIDRISDTTTFNEIPLFTGREVTVLNPDGTPSADGAIPFKDFSLADLSLGQGPLSSSGTPNTLALYAKVNNPSLASNGKSFNLIYGSGSTSHPGIRLTYSNGTPPGVQNLDINFSSLTPSSFDKGTDGGKSYWTRDYQYTNEDGVNITITQKVTIEDDTDTKKSYGISYSIKNNSSFDVSTDIMFHADTAYNNNDTCEGYYINGTRVNKVSAFSNGDSKYTLASTKADKTGVPDSFSIVDVDAALAFSEKIEFDSANKPDCLSVGIYSSIDDWNYYDSLDSNLGQNAIKRDLGFSAIWNEDVTSGSSFSVGFKYGIVPTETDPDLISVPVSKNDTVEVVHKANKPIWIQSGAEPHTGMDLIIGEMNTEILGIKNMDVRTVKGAEEAMTSTKGALIAISKLRSDIGAQQNRLEHTISNENNIVENTTAAESQIRDTDMAKEMVAYSNNNILMQAGQAMLAQANQSNQGILALLS